MHWKLLNLIRIKLINWNEVLILLGFCSSLVMSSGGGCTFWPNFPMFPCAFHSSAIWLTTDLKERMSCSKNVDFRKIFFFSVECFFNRIGSKGELACKSQASLVTVKGLPFQGKCSISSYRYIPTNFIYCLYLWFFHSVSTEETAAPLSIFCRIEWYIQKCTEPKRNGWWHKSLILGSVLSQYSAYEFLRKHTFSIFIHTLCRYGGFVFA